MVKINFKPWDCEGKFDKGTTLSEAAESLDIKIESLCGGEGNCGKCKAIIEKGHENLSSLSPSERKLLSEEEREKGFRLSCQARSESGEIQVRIPEASRKEGHIILVGGRRVEFERSPFVQKYHLRVPRPDLENFTADYERVKEALDKEYRVSVDTIDRLVQESLPNLLRKKEDTDENFFDVTVTLWGGEEIIDLEPGGEEGPYGMAFDIGTTTIVGYLINLNSGEVESVGSTLNPQAGLGEDLMTRVTYVSRKEGGTYEMRRRVLEGVNETIDDILSETEIDRDDIYEAVLVGNTAMHHFFHGIETIHLSTSPFIPGRQSSMAVKARDAGIDINPGGYSYWLPNNGGWVGSDNVAVQLVTRIYERKEMTLVIDIGTNGEVALGNREKALVTSTAAGPAFEGASIRHGERAQEGSIESVKIDPETLESTCETINDKRPIGICGSGIVDAVAEMVRCGIVERDGRFKEDKLENPLIRRGEGGILEHVLVRGEESGTNSDVTITQKDVREIQKTKGAVQAASRVLMDKLGVEKIDRVFLSGAFGNYLDKESAMVIGLFPECDLEKVESIGNAAGEGAKIALLDESKRREADEIPDLVEFVEIAGTDEFESNFITAIHFPHKDESLYPRTEKMLSKSTP